MGSADAMQHILPGKITRQHTVRTHCKKEGAFLLESLSCDCEIVWIWRTTFEQQHDPIHSTMLYTFRISYLVLIGASFWAITWLGPRMSKVQINFHHRFAKPRWLKSSHRARSCCQRLPLVFQQSFHELTSSCTHVFAPRMHHNLLWHLAQLGCFGLTGDHCTISVHLCDLATNQLRLWKARLGGKRRATRISMISAQ